MFKLFKSWRMAQRVNDFSIRIADKDWDSKWIDLISAHTVRADVNLVKREVRIHIRQLNEGVIQEAIFHTLSKEEGYGIIDEIRILPAKKQSYEYIFKTGRLINHECSFNYNRYDELVHTLVLQFDEVELKMHGNDIKLKRA